MIVFKFADSEKVSMINTRNIAIFIDGEIFSEKTQLFRDALIFQLTNQSTEIGNAIADGEEMDWRQWRVSMRRHVFFLLELIDGVLVKEPSIADGKVSTASFNNHLLTHELIKALASALLAYKSYKVRGENNINEVQHILTTLERSAAGM